MFTLKLGFRRENTYLVRFELPCLGNDRADSANEHYKFNSCLCSISLS